MQIYITSEKQSEVYPCKLRWLYSRRNDWIILPLQLLLLIKMKFPSDGACVISPDIIILLKVNIEILRRVSARDCQSHRSALFSDQLQWRMAMWYITRLRESDDWLFWATLNIFNDNYVHHKLTYRIVHIEQRRKASTDSVQNGIQRVSHGKCHRRYMHHQVRWLELSNNNPAVLRRGLIQFLIQAVKWKRSSFVLAIKCLEVSSSKNCFVW